MLHRGGYVVGAEIQRLIAVLEIQIRCAIIQIDHAVPDHKMVYVQPEELVHA